MKDEEIILNYPLDTSRLLARYEEDDKTSFVHRTCYDDVV